MTYICFKLLKCDKIIFNTCKTKCSKAIFLDKFIIIDDIKCSLSAEIELCIFKETLKDMLKDLK